MISFQGTHIFNMSCFVVYLIPCILTCFECVLRAGYRLLCQEGCCCAASCRKTSKRGHRWGSEGSGFLRRITASFYTSKLILKYFLACNSVHYRGRFYPCHFLFLQHLRSSSLWFAEIIVTVPNKSLQINVRIFVIKFYLFSKFNHFENLLVCVCVFFCWSGCLCCLVDWMSLAWLVIIPRNIAPALG